ncbi:MAG: DNA replication/repair protein RecF [Hyphomicrobiaceae bacterium]|nr:DNA replication/repair protein RecF [Hyphomicrobiaceae bacterium]
MWISRLVLTDFRNHARLSLELDRRPVVLAGPNGAGKTNVLEAVSLLAAGQGLRRVPYDELARHGGNGGWAVAATLQTESGPVEIGTGHDPMRSGSQRPGQGRSVRVNGEPQTGSGVLADLVEMVWLVPAMDGLFTGPGGDRRRFLDRLVLCFDPGHGTRYGQLERAMRQRNRLLEDGVREPARFHGLEQIMAETGVAIAAARVATLAGLAATIEARRARASDSPFPWATLALEGTLEGDLAMRPAVEVEDDYVRRLAASRERDRAAGRTLEGPHRTDLVVGHGPKGMPASASSTGEQKALLVGLVLAHAELLAARRSGEAPFLLLDEIAAHLDSRRRAALFREITRLGSQAWMTGTDVDAFSAILNDAQSIPVTEGGIGGHATATLW